MTTLEQFKEFGILASFCYADDTGADWNIGAQNEAKAMRLFREADPETQKQMREIAATKFL